MFKTIDDIMYITDGNNPFRQGLIYGAGGLGYKPTPYNMIGGGIEDFLESFFIDEINSLNEDFDDLSIDEYEKLNEYQENLIDIIKDKAKNDEYYKDMLNRTIKSNQLVNDIIENPDYKEELINKFDENINNTDNHKEDEKDEKEEKENNELDDIIKQIKQLEKIKNKTIREKQLLSELFKKKYGILKRMKGKGLDKEGNVKPPLKESTLNQKSDEELNNILIDNLEQIETTHYDKNGNIIELPEDIKKDFTDENNVIKNILFDRKVKNIEKFDKSIDKENKIIENEKEKIDKEKENIDKVRETLEDNILDGKISFDEAVKILKSYKSFDADIFKNRVDELINKKQKIINELISVKGKNKFDVNDIYDLPIQKLRELKKSISGEARKLIKLENKGISVPPSVKRIEETQRYIEELRKKKEDLNEIPEEIKNKYSIKTKFNKEYFDNPDNIKFPSIKADKFEFETVGISPSDYIKINGVESYKLGTKTIYNIKDTFQDLYDDKFDTLRAIISTLDNETYEKIIKDKNAVVKVINTGQNYYDENDKVKPTHKADVNAPLDNVVIIKSNGKEYKYAIENKNYNKPTGMSKKALQENPENFFFEKKIEYNDELFLDFIQVEENDNIIKNNEFIKKINKLKIDGYESNDEEIINLKENIKLPNIQDIRYSFLQKVLPKTIDVKYTKGGLKPHKIQYNDKGMNVKETYDYISKRAEANKFIDFDKNGKIYKIVDKNDNELNKETELFKGSKLLHAINYPDYFVGTNYSNLIKTGKVDKDNVLNTNPLTRDYYNPKLGDLSIGYYPEDYEIIRMENKKGKKNKSLYKNK